MLEWIPVPTDIAKGSRSRGCKLPAIAPPPGLEDFQQAWFWNLFWACLRNERIGYLPIASNLWSIAGAKRRDFWEAHKSRVLACFEVRQMDGNDVLVYPPLQTIIQRQVKKLKISEVSTAIHSVRESSLTLAFDFDSKKTRRHECGTDQDGGAPDRKKAASAGAGQGPIERALAKRRSGA